MDTLTPPGHVSRRQLIRESRVAVDKTNEVVSALDSCQNRVGQIGQQQAEVVTKFAAVEAFTLSRTAELQKGIDAQRRHTDAIAERLDTKMADHQHHVVTTLANEQRHYVDTQDKRLRADVDRQVVELARRQERFEQMGFLARLRWAFLGKVD